jgi:hypothetical protein
MPKRYRPLQSPNPIRDHLQDSDDDISGASVNPSVGNPQASESSASQDAQHAAVADAPAPQTPSPSHIAAQCAAEIKLPVSPGRNRAAFMAQHSPSRLTCNLDLSRCPIGTKVTVTAVVIAAFPAATNPDRRYIQLADCTGSVGITVWNDNVARFNRDSIGRVVVCSKVVLGNHQGKKVLTMTRESVLEFVTDDSNPLLLWWKSIASVPPKRLVDVADVDDNSIVNVSGILGLVSSEQKNVGSTMKTLTTLHLSDPSGQFNIRSWNHAADQFVNYVEKPVLIQRVRVSSFAGIKVGELLDNDGSQIVTDFAGSKKLAQYWVD